MANKEKKSSLQARKLEILMEEFRDKEPRSKAESTHFIRLWHEYIYPMRFRLLAAICLSLILSQEGVVWGFMSKVVVDTILMIKEGGMTVPAGEIHKHLMWVIYLFIGNASFHLLIVGASWLSTYNITLIGQHVVFNLRKALHTRLQSLPLSFFDQTQTGRLLSVVLDDVSTIQQSVGGLAVNFINQAMTIIIGLTVLSILNWKLTLFTLVIVPFYVFNFKHFRPKIRDGNITARRANTALYNKVEEKVSAIKTIKVFGRERTEIRLFTEGANNLARLMLHIVRLGTIQNILAVTVNSAAVYLFIYFGLQSFRNGEMTLGSIFWFIGLSRRLFDPAVALNDLITMEIPRVSVVLRRIFDLMDADPETIDKENAIELLDSKGEISMKDVTFTYPGDASPTLYNISFDIRSGEQVAIIGPSGSGKSSLLYLLMRFYDPQEGVITIDNNDICDIKLLSLRDRITLVMQEPVIFSGTVAENIKYGRLDASDAEVVRASRDADLHNFVMTLPESYQTVVGERGMALSGGQRQRLALAASLISRPSVLLLDDTTSALDAGTEAKIRLTLQKLLKGRTSFMVTHRISSAMKCDKVIVLEDGRVTQFGSPTDLLKQDGLFARIYEQQTRESADSATN